MSQSPSTQEGSGGGGGLPPLHTTRSPVSDIEVMASPGIRSGAPPAALQTESPSETSPPDNMRSPWSDPSPPMAAAGGEGEPAHHHPAMIRSAALQLERAVLGHHRVSLKDLVAHSNEYFSPHASARQGQGQESIGTEAFAAALAANGLPLDTGDVELVSGSSESDECGLSSDSSISSEESEDEVSPEMQLLRRNAASDDSDDGFYTSEEEVAQEADDDGSGRPRSGTASGTATPTIRAAGTTLRPPRNSSNTPDARRSPLFFARHRKLKRHKRAPSYAHMFPPADSVPPVPAIESHGLIGNCLTTALVSSTAVVDWMCFPHHDSPPLFFHLIDQQRGGYFRITAASEVRQHQGSMCHLSGMVHSAPSPASAGNPHAPQPHMHRVSTRQMYSHDSNVLLTRYFTDSGVGHVMDYMPLGEYADSRGARSWLVRELECVRGKMYFEVECMPTFNFGRDQHHVDILPSGALFQSERLSMLLTSSRARVWRPTARGGARTNVTLEEGQRVVFVLRPWDAKAEEKRWTEKREQRALVERQRRFLQEQIEKMRREDPASFPPSLAPTPAQSTRNIAKMPGAGGDGHEQHQLHGAFSSVVSPIHPPQGTNVAPLHVPLSGASTPVPSSPAAVRPRGLPLSTRSSTRSLHRSSSRVAFSQPADPDKFGLHCIHPIPSTRTDRLRRRTMEYWRRWLERFNYEGRWREAVRRSVLMLKLLTFEPTGAIISAPTCGIPSSPGVGGRDLRLVNLRDASFAVCTFLKLGFRNEAAAWMDFVQRLCREHQRADGSLQPVFGIRGEHDLAPQAYPDVAGYKGAGPVCTGDPSFGDKTLEHYGALLIAFYVVNKYAEPLSWELWRSVRSMVNYVVAHWEEPQPLGLWVDMSDRTPGHYTISKLLAWVCVDRGLHLAHDRSLPASVPEWTRARNTLAEEIMRRAYRPDLGYFAQAYDNSNLDASVLLMPITSFLTPTDPTFERTLNAMLRTVAQDGLLSHSLLHRYNEHGGGSKRRKEDDGADKAKSQEDADDEREDDDVDVDANVATVASTGASCGEAAGQGHAANVPIPSVSLPPRHNDSAGGVDDADNYDDVRVPPATTTICSFWAIEACCRGGLASHRALDRARMLMEQTMSFANHLNLFAEGLGPRGEFVGPYPHVLTHVALVRAAIHLDRALRNHRPTIMETPLFAGVPLNAPVAPQDLPHAIQK